MHYAVAVQVLHAQRNLQEDHPQQGHEGHADGLLRHHLAWHSTAQHSTQHRTTPQLAEEAQPKQAKLQGVCANDVHCRQSGKNKACWR
jgi:hypothetical protein